MESVCDVVPRSYQDECLTLMREYGDKVAEMIILEGTAHGVCAALHLCLWTPSPPAQAPSDITLVGEAMLPFDRYMPQTMVEDELTKEDDTTQRPSCALCEFVMTRLETMLNDNATEVSIPGFSTGSHFLPEVWIPFNFHYFIYFFQQEIKDTVMQICNYLPHTLKQECRDFIDEYGDTVIQYLTQQMDPKEICTELKFCTADFDSKG